MVPPYYAFTVGFERLPVEERDRAADEFLKKQQEARDYCYTLLDGRVYAVENGTGGFTFMLGEEY